MKPWLAAMGLYRNEVEIISVQKVWNMDERPEKDEPPYFLFDFWMKEAYA